MSKGIADLLELYQVARSDRNADPQFIDISDDDANDVFDALSSETTRTLLSNIREQPCAPPDLANELDTSIQNVHYHLDKLKEANLIEPINTWYSEKGVEMKVYAPASDPLVISSASEQQRSTLRTALTRLFGAVALLAGLSFGVQWWVMEQLSTSGEPQGPQPGIPEGGSSESVTLVIPPGLLFFLGGVVVLILVSGWWYAQSRSCEF